MAEAADTATRAQEIESPSFVRSTIVTYGTSLAGAVLSLVSVLIVARALGPSGRGQVAFLTTVATLSAAVATFGIQNAILRFAGARQKERPALATNAAIFAMILGVGAATVLGALMVAIPELRASAEPRLIALSLLAIPILVFQTYLIFLVNADYGFAVANTAVLMGPVTNLVGNASLAIIGHLSVGTAVVTWVLGQGLGTLLLATFVVRRLAGFGRPSPTLARESLAFGAKSQLGGLMQVANLRLDQWILGVVAGPTTLGLYSVAVAWAEALSFLPRALTIVLKPDLVRAVRADAARLTSATFRAAVLVMAPLVVLVVLAAPFLCGVIFGSAFADAAPMLQILAPGAFGIVGWYLVQGALVSQGQPWRSTLATAAAFGCTVLLDLLLIPPFGGIGASVASTAAYCVGGAAAIAILCRTLGIRAGSFVPRLADLAVIRQALLRSGWTSVGMSAPPWPRRATPAAWVLAGAMLALALGAATAVNVQVALLLAAAVVLGLVLLARPSALLAILVVAMGFEAVSVGTVTFSRLVAPLALLMLLGGCLAGGRLISWRRPMPWVVAYATWATASGLWTVDTGATVFKLTSLGIAIVFMLAFTFYVRTGAQVEQVFYYLVATGVATGLLTLGSLVAGAARHGSTPVGDPNFFASFEIIVLPIALVLGSKARRRSTRALLGAAVLIIIAATLASLSRGGLLSLVGVMLLLLAMPARAIFGSRGRKFLLVACILAGGAVALQSFSAALLPRLEAVFVKNSSTSPSEAEGSGRTNIWRGALVGIEEHPVLGLGYGGFPSESTNLIRSAPGVDLVNWALEPQGSEVHNAYLSTTAELGFPGLFLFLGLLLSTALALRRVAHRAARIGESFVARAANALLVGLAGWAIASFFLSSEASRPLWIVIGLSLALTGICERAEERLPELDAPLALGPVPSPRPGLR